MKGQQFHFTRLIPTVDDAEAASHCLDQFVQHETDSPLRMRPGETTVHNFISGFYRGLAWALQQDLLPMTDTLAAYHEMSIGHQPGSDPSCSQCRTVASARERLANAR